MLFRDKGCIQKLRQLKSVLWTW